MLSTEANSSVIVSSVESLVFHYDYKTMSIISTASYLILLSSFTTTTGWGELRPRELLAQGPDTSQELPVMVCRSDSQPQCYLHQLLGQITAHREALERIMAQ